MEIKVVHVFHGKRTIAIVNLPVGQKIPLGGFIYDLEVRNCWEIQGITTHLFPKRSNDSLLNNAKNGEFDIVLSRLFGDTEISPGKYLLEGFLKKKRDNE